MLLPADPPTATVRCPSCGHLVALRCDVTWVDDEPVVDREPLRRGILLHMRVCDPSRVETIAT